METYMGTKIIRAVPAIRKGGIVYESNDPRPKSMDPQEDGYKVVYADGYESWSPKSVFETSYRRIGDLTFGMALELVKIGHKIVRSGWNGKGMYVYYVPAKSYPAVTEVAKNEFGAMVPYNAYFAIKNVNGTVSTWVPSVNDCLAEDWSIIE